MRDFFQPIMDCNQLILSKSPGENACLRIVAAWLAVLAAFLAFRYFFDYPFLGWQEEVFFQSLMLLLVIGHRTRHYSVRHQLMMGLWLSQILFALILFVFFAEMARETLVPLHVTYLLTFLLCSLYMIYGFLSSTLEICAILLARNSGKQTIAKIIKKQINIREDIRSAMVVVAIVMGFMFMAGYLMFRDIIPLSIYKFIDSTAFVVLPLLILAGFFRYKQLCRIRVHFSGNDAIGEVA